MSIMDEIHRIPPWGWAVAAGGAGLVFLLHRGSSSSSNTQSTVDPNQVNTVPQTGVVDQGYGVAGALNQLQDTQTAQAAAITQEQQDYANLQQQIADYQNMTQQLLNQIANQQLNHQTNPPPSTPVPNPSPAPSPAPQPAPQPQSTPAPVYSAPPPMVPLPPVYQNNLPGLQGSNTGQSLSPYATPTDLAAAENWQNPFGSGSGGSYATTPDLFSAWGMSDPWATGPAMPPMTPAPSSIPTNWTPPVSQQQINQIAAGSYEFPTASHDLTTTLPDPSAFTIINAPTDTHTFTGPPTPTPPATQGWGNAMVPN